MSAPTTPAHYLRPNHVTSIPRRFVYLDSEAHQRAHQGARRQHFRLAVAAFEKYNADDQRWGKRTTTTYSDPHALWVDIDAVCATKARTIVWAHNLAYDLRITHGLTELAKLGWEMRAVKLDGGHAWASYRKGTRTLMLCDTMSWVPHGLDTLAPMLGMAKCPLPPWEDTFEAWEARCVRDVEILAEAVHRLMRFVVDADLGNWRPTGAGQAWSAFRHRFMAHDLLVHDDQEAREAERRAVHTGRCEAWRWGNLSGGPFTEWDYSAAYATVGKDRDVPVRLLRSHRALEVEQWRRLAEVYAVCANVRVRTMGASVPLRLDDRIVWPVGEFRTTLWENELALALDEGAHVEIERAWVYEREPALRAFCTWCLDLLDEERTDVDPVARLLVKHFSRALIGRFGARWRKWGAAGVMDFEDVRRWRDINGDDGTKTEYLQVARQVWAETGLTDAPDCLPQIMSWVTAECRVRLWRATRAAGPEHVAYLDTDSLICDLKGSERLRGTRIPGLRPKGSWRSVEVLGPRQLVLDGSVRAAGLPRGARKLSDGSFSAETWRTLDRSLKEGEAHTVVIAERRARLRGTDRRRLHLPGGQTAPLTVTLDGCGPDESGRVL